MSLTIDVMRSSSSRLEPSNSSSSSCERRRESYLRLANQVSQRSPEFMRNIGIKAFELSPGDLLPFQHAIKDDANCCNSSGNASVFRR